MFPHSAFTPRERKSRMRANRTKAEAKKLVSRARKDTVTLRKSIRAKEHDELLEEVCWAALRLAGVISE